MIPFLTENYTNVDNNVSNIIDKVVIGIDWKKLEKHLLEKLNHSKIASEIFKTNNYWKNKNYLVKAINEFSSLTGFTTCVNDRNSILCNRYGDSCIRSKSGVGRNTSSGDLKCNCPWKIRFVSIKKKIVESTKKIKKLH